MLGFSLLGFFLQNIRTCADKISHCPESSRWSRIVKILVAHVALNAFQNLIFSEELLSCLSVQDFEKVVTSTKVVVGLVLFGLKSTYER